MRGFLKVLCGCSLLLNMVLIGLISGHIYKRWSAQSYQSVQAELSPETRDMVGQTFKNTFREVKDLGDGARLARADLVEILSAEEFDGAAYDMVVARLMDVRNDMQGLKVQAVRELAMTLPAAERQALAARMAKMAGGGERRGGKHYGPPSRDILR